jgi:hypothetical protein
LPTPFSTYKCIKLLIAYTLEIDTRRQKTLFRKPRESIFVNLKALAQN